MEAKNELFRQLRRIAMRYGDPAEAVEETLMSLWRNPEAKRIRRDLRALGVNDWAIESEAARPDAPSPALHPECDRCHRPGPQPPVSRIVLVPTSMAARPWAGSAGVAIWAVDSTESTARQALSSRPRNNQLGWAIKLSG